MSSDKISIIMGIYNCEETLNESIESILNQSYKNWELIMCDDASTDKTFSIAEEYSKKDSRIRLIKNQENKGLAYSLNHCIKYATGDYVARHDGDDVCKLNRFEKQIKFIKKYDFDLIGSAVEYFDSQGVWGKHYLKQYPDKNDVFKQSMFSHPTILVKKAALYDVDGYTVSNITNRTEDYDLFVKLYAKGYRGANMQEVLFSVRRDKDAYQRRKFKFRIDESFCKVRAWNLLSPDMRYVYFIFIPIIKGLVPASIMKKYHNKKFSIE